MLSEEEIQRALGADRVVPLGEFSAHGPLGLEHLAAIVERLRCPLTSVRGSALIERPIALPLETWEKLDRLARLNSQPNDRTVSPSAVAAELLKRCIADA